MKACCALLFVLFCVCEADPDVQLHLSLDHPDDSGTELQLTLDQHHDHGTENTKDTGEDDSHAFTTLDSQATTRTT